MNFNLNWNRLGIQTRALKVHASLRFLFHSLFREENKEREDSFHTIFSPFQFIEANQTLNQTKPNQTLIMKSYVSVPTAILLLTIFSFSSLAVDLPKFCVATITKKANKVKDGERVTIKRYSEFDKDEDFNTIFLKDMELNNDREVVGVKINENELKKGLDKTSKEVLWYFPSSTITKGIHSFTYNNKIM